MAENDIFEMAEAETKRRVSVLLKLIKNLPEDAAVDMVHEFICNIVDSALRTGVVLGRELEGIRLRKLN